MAFAAGSTMPAARTTTGPDVPARSRKSVARIVANCDFHTGTVSWGSVRRLQSPQPMAVYPFTKS